MEGLSLPRSNSALSSASALLVSSAAAPPHADLAQPGRLASALRSRTYRGELILFSFDFCGIGEALSMALTLRSIGFEHFVPMSDGAETCETLRTAARTRDIQPLWPCWYSSWPRDHPGWKVWGTAPGCVSAARASHTCVLEQLWASRYHVAAQILAAGINLLHVDTDSAFLSDPYALLKSPPLSRMNFVFLPEAPANGGMWYAQNTTAGRRCSARLRNLHIWHRSKYRGRACCHTVGAGAAWVIAEVARRTMRVIGLALPPRRKALPPFDRAMARLDRLLCVLRHPVCSPPRVCCSFAPQKPCLATSSLLLQIMVGRAGVLRVSTRCSKKRHSATRDT